LDFFWSSKHPGYGVPELLSHAPTEDPSEKKRSPIICEHVLGLVTEFTHRMEPPGMHRLRRLDHQIVGVAFSTNPETPSTDSAE